MWLERLRKCITKGRQRKRNKNEKRERREDEDRREKRQKTLTRILATVVDRDGRDRNRQLGNLGGGRWQEPRRPRRDHSPLEKDQCAHCREKGHWARECPKKKQGTKVLSLENDED